MGTILQGEADFDRHLPMGDAVVFDLSARLDHLEPAQVAERLGGFRHRVLDRFFNAVRGGTDELDFFVDVIAH
jgi:hypothetical protein